MNKLVMLIQIFVMIFIVSIFAQEEKSPPHNMIPPPPLDDAFMNWMVGEWKGNSKSAMGTSTDHMKCEMAVDGQFMIMTYKSKMEDGREMMGMGTITINQEGKLAGYWIDSWRTMSEGHGVREGNTSRMEWTTSMGPYVRTTKKVDENTMEIYGVMTGSDGKEMISETKLIRAKSKN